MIFRSSHARAKILTLAVSVFLCLATPCISSYAQQNKECVADRTFAKVGSLLEKQDDSAAKKLLHELESCPHLSPIQRFNIGWLYGKAHDASDALRLFKSGSEDVPDRLTHGYAIALSSFELGQYQEAVNTLTALRSAGFFDARCADLLGVSYSKLEKYQDAYTIMVENIQQNPSNPYGYFNLITLFVDTAELEKAAHVADKAVAAFPQSPEALSMRGTIELTRDRYTDAYRDFSAAMQLAPRAADPPFFMALVDYRQSKYDEAEKVLRDALASGIQDSDLHYLLAECMLRVDATDRDHPLSELNQAIAINPNSVSARALRGSTLLEAGRAKEALADLKIAHDLDPTPQRDTRNTTYLLGRAYAALGKREEAKELFAQLGHQFSGNKADSLNQLSEQKMRAALHP